MDQIILALFGLDANNKKQNKEIEYLDKLLRKWAKYEA